MKLAEVSGTAFDPKRVSLHAQSILADYHVEVTEVKPFGEGGIALHLNDPRHEIDRAYITDQMITIGKKYPKKESVDGGRFIIYRLCETEHELLDSIDSILEDMLGEKDYLFGE